MAQNTKISGLVGTVLTALLRPLPAFLIVTAVVALVRGIPSIQEMTGPDSAFGTSAIFFHFILPPALGLLAALAAHLGRSLIQAEELPRPGADAEPRLGADERARALTRHMPLALVTVSKEGTVLYRNPAAASLFGGAVEASDRLSAFVQALGSGPWIEGVFQGTAFAREETFHRPEGEAARRILKITGVPLTRGDRPVEALLLIEDVTDLKDTEDMLIRSEERYRNIFNHAACGIFFVDTKGNYLDANPAALEMLGYTLDELLKLNTREVSSASEDRIRRLKAATDWIVEEVRYLRKDGKVVEAEIAASSFRSTTGTYFIGITTDLTARRVLERSLSAERRNVAALVGLAADPLIAVQRDGRILAASPSAIELLGSDAERVLDGAVRPTDAASPGADFEATVEIPHGPPVTCSARRALPLGLNTATETILIKLQKSV